MTKSANDIVMSRSN